MYISKNGVCKFILAICLAVMGTSAQATIVQWASAVSNTNVPDAINVLGSPDGVLARFGDGNEATTETGTYFGFGNGDNSNYDSATFAALLGISELLLEQADFITFEHNGLPNITYETADWVFDDGTSSLTVPFTFGDSASGAIIALGNVDNSAYANFFGFQNPFNSGDNPYLLFDIDGNSNVNLFSSSFNVTLSTPGFGFASPNPDGMARIGVIPEPSVLIEDTIDNINMLVNVGILKEGDGKSLTTKLDKALKELNKGMPDKAIRKLNDFIEKVNKLIKKGILSTAEGQSLIDVVQTIIESINATTAPALNLRSKFTTIWAKMKTRR